MQIQERVRKIVADTLGVALSDVLLDADFEGDLGASLDYFQIFMRCEEEFDITIPDEDLAYLNTLRYLVVYIDKKVRSDQFVWSPPATLPEL